MGNRHPLVKLRMGWKDKVNNIVPARGTSLPEEPLSSEKNLAGVPTLPFVEIVQIEPGRSVDQNCSLNESIGGWEQVLIRESSEPLGRKSLNRIVGAGSVMEDRYRAGPQVFQYHLPGSAVPMSHCRLPEFRFFGWRLSPPGDPLPQSRDLVPARPAPDAHPFLRYAGQEPT